MKFNNFKNDEPAAQLRIHHFEPITRSNGPGVRTGIWVQGCSLNCTGCFNPQTHAINGGKLLYVETLFQKISNLVPQIEGITISGGEPLLQIPALNHLFIKLKSTTTLSTIILTGYKWDEMIGLPGIDTLIKHTDVIITGPYIQNQRIASSLCGSGNKIIHFLSNRYTENDFQGIPTSEILLKPDGSRIITGINPVRN